MNKKLNTVFFAFMILLWGISWQGMAQFQQLPTPRKPSPSAQNFQRVMEEKLSLPFWDDFSSAGIDSSKWINEGATQSFTVANAAPSLGVLLLDGVDESGKPYSNVPIEQGITDIISSRPIDLSSISSNESSTLFLSFFWQAGGKAEMPDANDNLTLLFRDTLGNWINVWQIAGELPAEQFFFTQEIIQVEEAFQHADFQFRFQINGRASGPFDSWLIDYVYLNTNRSTGDIFYPDRTLTTQNLRPSQKYTGIPVFEASNLSGDFWRNTGNEFKNLENRFRAMEYSVEIRDKSDNSLISRVNNNTPFNPVPLGSERRIFESNPISGVSLPEEETDYEITTYISSGDLNLFQMINGDSVFFDDINLRVNDTVRSVISFRDYFAYDDGNIDYSAGINQRSGSLVNRFETSTNPYVKGISINFTNQNQANQIIDLSIWQDLQSDPIYVREIFIPEKENLEEFSYFELDENIRVSEIFFVGFTQFTNDFIHVGLDKTFDNGREIFYNVAGPWQQNELVEGSLMIRVHLSETPVVEESTEEEESSLRVYPNPVENRLFVEGKVETFSVFDPYGRQLDLTSEESDNGKIINFAGLQKGIYVLKIVQGEKNISKRILVK
ncbi:T9SS type A sorting domain-containing protein [Arthrospiribacter ruber]|uniref:T9SS C-terminal target domain-containing protein n=1 Tax=Arthrospiribacter ruber TaxID=2487934 RepID=A0A951IY04_9BACT|nr:T9SS type A sorting domain-containing protein [Arthrospiribacter ruber]MBW3468199.1 T9SS C-terminal target domain-containing protein [Arthrospiribacter ruber]